MVRRAFLVLAAIALAGCSDEGGNADEETDPQHIPGDPQDNPLAGEELLVGGESHNASTSWTATVSGMNFVVTGNLAGADSCFGIDLGEVQVRSGTAVATWTPQSAAAETMALTLWKDNQATEAEESASPLTLDLPPELSGEFLLGLHVGGRGAAYDQDVEVELTLELDGPMDLEATPVGSCL